MRRSPVPCSQLVPGDNRALSACSQPPQRAAHKERSAHLDTRHTAALAEPGVCRYPEPEDGVCSVFLVECMQ